MGFIQYSEPSSELALRSHAFSGEEKAWWIAYKVDVGIMSHLNCFLISPRKTGERKWKMLHNNGDMALPNINICQTLIYLQSLKNITLQSVMVLWLKTFLMCSVSQLIEPLINHILTTNMLFTTPYKLYFWAGGNTCFSMKGIQIQHNNGYNKQLIIHKITTNVFPIKQLR